MAVGRKGEVMTDYINRETAKMRAIKHVEDDELADAIVAELNKIPSADVVERKHGEWIIHKINGTPHTAECSYCNKHYDYEELRKLGGMKNYIDIDFCPSCGADMRKQTERNIDE